VPHREDRPDHGRRDEGLSDPRFSGAIARFDEVDAGDPRRARFGEREGPLSALHHERVAHWVRDLRPDASEALSLAARCQHLARWETLRADFPDGVLGYKRWRSEAARRSAARAGAILAEVGWDDASARRVGELVTKRGLGRDDEVQVLEDAACLAFLELELDAFAAKHPPERVAGVLDKTLRKMSEEGKARARALMDQVARAPARG
jgi:hypothetical protein